MNNVAVVNAFVDTLLEAPDLTMQAVALRLSATNFELKLLRCDLAGRLERDCWNPPAGFEFDEGGIASFPIKTGERGIPVK